MIRIEGRAVTFGEVWFDEEAAASPRVDILIHRQRPAALRNRTCSPFLTLVNDVTMDEDRMLAGFGRTLRYHINRAQSRDGVQASVVTATPKRSGHFRISTTRSPDRNRYNRLTVAACGPQPPQASSYLRRLRAQTRFSSGTRTLRLRSALRSCIPPPIFAAWKIRNARW